MQSSDVENATEQTVPSETVLLTSAKLSLILNAFMQLSDVENVAERIVPSETEPSTSLQREPSICEDINERSNHESDTPSENKENIQPLRNKTENLIASINTNVEDATLGKAETVMKETAVDEGCVEKSVQEDHTTPEISLVKNYGSFKDSKSPVKTEAEVILDILFVLKTCHGFILSSNCLIVAGTFTKCLGKFRPIGH